MAEPELDPAAAVVRRDDPLLFRTALFAAEPARGRLMTLYAFDIELSRALTRTQEPMIAQMRLQWWRDVLEAAAAGGPAPQHEVAGPLHALVSDGFLPLSALHGLIDARDAEIDGLADRDALGAWADRRFGALVRLAAACLGAEQDQIGEAADAAGQAMAAAFVLRNAGPMAADGRPPLLPGLAQEDRTALARGETSPGARAAASALAETGLAALARARRHRRAVPPQAPIAFLPLAPAKPVLRAAVRPDAELTRLPAPPTEGATLAMLWRAISGRW